MVYVVINNKKKGETRSVFVCHVILFATPESYVPPPQNSMRGNLWASRFQYDTTNSSSHRRYNFVSKAQQQQTKWRSFLLFPLFVVFIFLSLALISENRLKVVCVLCI